jgi:RNA polymerase sigma factor (sigma-70 family)
VFLNVWRNADRYDCSRGTVINWLSEMSFFRAIDRTRRAGSSTGSATPCGRVLRTPPEAQGSPEELLVALQEEVALEAAVDRLSSLRRILIRLAFFHQLSHAEIADRIPLPLGTIKSHIRRALVQLRSDVESTRVTGIPPKVSSFQRLRPDSSNELAVTRADLCA